jgi:hypothetical protein
VNGGIKAERSRGGDMIDLDPNHIAWCRYLFDTMSEGCVWTIPSSGMRLVKRGHVLVLIETMPHMAGMPCSEAELLQQQRNELQLNRLYFGAIGVTILNEAGL